MINMIIVLTNSLIEFQNFEFFFWVDIICEYYAVRWNMQEINQLFLN